MIECLQKIKNVVDFWKREKGLPSVSANNKKCKNDDEIVYNFFFNGRKNEIDVTMIMVMIRKNENQSFSTARNNNNNNNKMQTGKKDWLNDDDDNIVIKIIPFTIII